MLFISTCSWMYWSDWGDAPTIERASMDGRAREILHNTQLFMEYFLLDDCSFSHPLPYYSEEDRLEMLLMNDIQLIQLVLQKDLEKLKVKNLTELPDALSATSSQ